MSDARTLDLGEDALLFLPLFFVSFPPSVRRSDLGTGVTADERVVQKIKVDSDRVPPKLPATKPVAAIAEQYGDPSVGLEQNIVDCASPIGRPPRLAQRGLGRCRRDRTGEEEDNLADRRAHRALHDRGKLWAANAAETGPFA